MLLLELRIIGKAEFIFLADFSFSDTYVTFLLDILILPFGEP